MADSKRVVYREVDGPRPGDLAIREGIDAREIARVETVYYFTSFGGGETGPFPAENYIVKRRTWV